MRPQEIPADWKQPVEDVIAMMCVVQREARIEVANSLTRRFVLAIIPTAVQAWQQAGPGECRAQGCPCRHEALCATVADARSALTSESRVRLTEALFARLERFLAERN